MTYAYIIDTQTPAIIQIENYEHTEAKELLVTGNIIKTNFISDSGELVHETRDRIPKRGEWILGMVFVFLEDRDEAYRVYGKLARIDYHKKLAALNESSDACERVRKAMGEVV